MTPVGESALPFEYNQDNNLPGIRSVPLTRNAIRVPNEEGP